MEHPTLSTAIDVSSFGVARLKASDSRLKYGAIVVVDCEKDEFDNQGGLGVDAGVPNRKYTGDRRFLRLILQDKLYSSKDLRRISRERVVQIILIPEEAKK